MSEKQTIIDKLYALRAGLSVLSMQYDQFFNTHCEIEKACADMAQELKIILGPEDEISFWEMPAFLNGSVRKHNGLPTFSYSGSDNAFYWTELLRECCYFDMNDYLNHRVSYSKKHYQNLIDLNKKYKYVILNNYEELYYFDREYAFFHSNKEYEHWKKSFSKDPYEQQLAIDCLVSIVDEEALNKEDCDDDMSYYASCLLDNIVGGHWLLTDEAYVHYKTKLKELNELVNAIIRNNEYLKKGLFRKLRNSAEIAKNETAIKLGSIAIRNAKNAIEFLESGKPKTAIKQKLQQIENIKSEFNQIFRALQDEFSSLLDARDWENVDLVIYFMETGRADTIKEALKQVDMERRTNRIVKTINAATDRICSTIAIGFATLNATMKQCFAVIESRIVEQNALLAQQNNAISELVSATNMSNALIAKQNTTSEQLMKDVRALKTAIVPY